MPVERETKERKKGIEALYVLMKNFADTHGCIINPDDRRVNLILRGLLSREERYGQLYCPCRVLTGDPTTDNDIVCPCVFREEDILQHGMCHCRLFAEKEKQE